LLDVGPAAWPLQVSWPQSLCQRAARSSGCGGCHTARPAGLRFPPVQAVPGNAGKFIVAGQAHAFQVFCCARRHTRAVAAQGELASYRAHGALRGGAVQRLRQQDFLSKLHNSKTHTSGGEHPSATPWARRWPRRWKQREDVEARAGQIAGQLARTPLFPHSLGSKPLADSWVSGCGWASRPQQSPPFFYVHSPRSANW